jgi:L-alanine-DL-glutamate epimerase-like enolase superfamily enzyme
MTAAHGAALCPHWLAGGVGLAASLHLVAAAGAADSWMEVDANPNPLREAVCPLALVDGAVTLSDAAGIGVEPDLAKLARYRVAID